MSESKCSYRIAYEKQKKRAERAEADLREYRNLCEVLMEGNRCSIKLASDLLVAESTIAELTATVERTDKERIELAKMLLHCVRSVPLGNQPHMSAEIAEKMALVALGDAS